MQTGGSGKQRGEGDDYNVFSTMQDLATALPEPGQLHAAAIMQRADLDRCRVLLGPDAPRTIKAMYDLAITTRDLGRYDEAISLQRVVLNKRRHLAEDDILLIDAMEALSLTLQMSHQLHESVWLQRKVMDMRKRTSDEEDLDVMIAMDNLALTMGKLGWHDAALSLNQQVLSRRIKYLGEEHRATITAKSNMATTLINLHKLNEASLLLQQVIAKSVQVLGDDHPDTLLAMHSLATTFHSLKQFDDALSMQKRLLEKRRTVLGNSHPETVQTMASLVQTFDSLAQYDQSAILETEVIEIQKQVYGKQHPMTIQAISNLAVTLDELGRLEEAIAMKKEVVDAMSQIIGPDHDDTIQAMISLANTLDKGEDIEAVRIRVEILEAMKRTCGEDHLDTISATRKLATSLETLGLFEEAITLRKKILEKYRRILGQGHRQTMTAMFEFVKTSDETNQSVDVETEAPERKMQALGPPNVDSAGKEALSHPANDVVIRPASPTYSVWSRLSTQQIRLIIIHAGEDDEPLVGTIFEDTLDEAEGTYAAISYAWGDPTSTSSIICNGHILQIPRTLHSALSRLRLPDQNMLFWCDALCIDQGHSRDSLEERAEQVQMMDRIFSGASQVVIDLGEDDGSLPQVVEGMNAILSSPPDLRAEILSQSEPLKYLGLPPMEHPMWPALRKFILRPWFRRIWCVQEAVLARDTKVVFGDHHVDIDQLSMIFNVFMCVHNREIKHYQADLTFDSLWIGSLTAVHCLLLTLSLRNGRDKKRSLCDLIQLTMLHKSTDQRDRVYALYGMVDATDLPVNYSEPYGQLSRRLSEFLIRSGYEVWTLVFCGGPGWGRPSWSLDLEKWDGRPLYNTLTGGVLTTGQCNAYAAGGTSEPRFRVVESTLMVHGFTFDKIGSLTPPNSFPTGPLLNLTAGLSIKPGHFFNVITWIDLVVQWARQYEMDEEALWRTLIVNQNVDENDPYRTANGRASSAYRDGFEQLLVWMDEIRSAMQAEFTEKTDTDPQDLMLPPKGLQYWTLLGSATQNRCIALTESRTLALVPQDCHVDDVLAVFQGVPLPFVLQKSDNDEYVVVGPCYVHGAMDGERFQLGLDPEEIVLR